MRTRRIVVEEGQQLELPIASAKPPLRRRLSLEEEEVVTMRVPIGVAQVIGAIGQPTLVQALEAVSQEMLYTEWSQERPPSCGYWEVKQRNVRDQVRYDWPRMWYEPGTCAWYRFQPSTTLYQAGVPYPEFVAAFEWRGLRAPWPAGYDYELIEANEANEGVQVYRAPAPARAAMKKAWKSASRNGFRYPRRHIEL